MCLLPRWTNLAIRDRPELSPLVLSSTTTRTCFHLYQVLHPVLVPITCTFTYTLYLYLNTLSLYPVPVAKAPEPKCTCLNQHPPQLYCCPVLIYVPGLGYLILSTASHTPLPLSTKFLRSEQFCFGRRKKV